MNNPDTNRTFIIDNVEDMNKITGFKWKQTDLKQYFEFLDSSGFNSSNNMLNFVANFELQKEMLIMNPRMEKEK